MPSCQRVAYVTTTDSDHDHPIAPNLLQQDFTAAAPNQRWVTDITYIPTREGWLFLAAIMSGSQYASDDYRQALAEHRLVASMSRRACC